MKVILILPPPPVMLSVLEKEIMSVAPPLGIAYIGAYLERAGHKVKIIDATACRIRIEEVVAEVKEFRPGFIGISAFTPVAMTCYALVNALKAEIPQTPVALGGPHATILAEDCLTRSKADFVVMGEGEITVAELVSSLDNGRQAFEEVDGLAFHRNGATVFTRQRKLIDDLNELPLPARHLLPMDKYHLGPHYYRKLPATPIITSRGCPFHCIFCDRGVFGNRFRARNPESIVEEMKQLSTQFGVKDFLFWDDTFTFDTDRVRKLCELLREMPKKVIWGCISRADRVSEDLLRDMKKAGCHYIGYGIETGSPRILKSIKKSLSLDQVRTTVRATKKAGIDVHGYYMIGLPGETVEDIQLTIDLAVELNTDFVTFTIATPYPGTELWKIAKKEGLLLSEDWTRFSRQSEEPAYAPRDIPAADLVKLLRQTYRKYYYRPKYIFGQVAGIRAPADFKRMYQAAKGLVRS